MRMQSARLRTWRCLRPARDLSEASLIRSQSVMATWRRSGQVLARNLSVVSVRFLLELSLRTRRCLALARWRKESSERWAESSRLSSVRRVRWRPDWAKWRSVREVERPLACSVAILVQAWARLW
jgi:hypothetical protein